MIVLAIIAILSAIAIPNYQWALIRAREAVLQENLYGIRSAIDQFHADQGRYPERLEDLTARKYLRSIPKDPFTRSAETWIIVPPSAELPPETADGNTAAVGTLPLPKGNVYDVQSGSELIGSNGIPYKDW
jgi:general secretion pathway protein G